MHSAPAIPSSRLARPFKASKRLVVLCLLAVLCLFAGHLSATDFVHPGLGVTKKQLDEMKAGVESGAEPWASWYNSIYWWPYTGLSGPCQLVSRNANVNLAEYDHDMKLISACAYVWYVDQTRNPDRANLAAQKGVAALEAWATTQTVGTGIEWSFEQGGSGYIAMTAAEILRYTYPGWTATNTAHTEKYFGDFWIKSLRIGSTNGPLDGSNTDPWLRGAGANLWSANQGGMSIRAMVGSAIYCNDRLRFNEALNAYLTSPDTGLLSTSPNGQMGDTGRDNGHAGQEYMDKINNADVFWSQGIDVYSLYGNRLRTISEYLAYRELVGLGLQAGPVPWINFGCEYGYFTSLPTFDGYIRMQDNMDMARQVYKARGFDMPYCDQLVTYSGYQRKTTIDTAPAVTPVVPAMWTEPTTTALTAATDLTACHVSGSSVTTSTATVSNGVWTLQPDSGGGEYRDFQFAYKVASGDITLIARVVSGDGMLKMTPSLVANMVGAGSISSKSDGSILCFWGGGRSSYSWPTWRGYYDASFAPPYWLKMVRRGNYINQCASMDGVHWTSLVNILYPLSGVSDTYYVGIGSFSGNGATFDNVSLGTAADSLPLAPTSVTAVPTSSSSAVITWPASTSATTLMYDVMRTDAAGNQAWLVTNLTDLTYTDTTAVSGTAYTYQIGVGGYSGRRLSTATALIGLAPTGLTATNGNAQVDLAWTVPTTGADSYTIKRGTVNGGPYTTIGTTTATSYTDSGVSNGGIYYYVVSATRAGFESVNSSEVVGLPATATGVWSSTPTSGLWSLGANWTGAAAPVSGTNLIFNASSLTTGLNNDLSGLTVGSVLFNASAGAYSIGGNAWSLSGMIANYSSSTQTLTTPITLTGTRTVNAGAGLLALNGVISGSGFGLTKIGAGSLALGAANTFTGGVTVNAGTVNAGNDAGFGTGTITLAGGTIGNAAQVAIANPISVTSGAIALNASYNLNVNSTITGTGTLTLGGNGPGYSLVMNGSLSGFSGTVAVASSNYPYVRFTSTAAGSAAATWALNNGNGGHTTLDFASGTIAFGALTGGGQIQGNSAGAKVLSVGAKGVDSTFSGTIANGYQATLALTKVGSGILTLSGSNTYSDATTVSAGTLNVTGSIVSPTTVATGARLAGSGTVSGLVTIASGGIVSPGAGTATATLTLGNGLTLNSGSVVTLGLDGTRADTIALSAGTYTPPASGTATLNLSEIATCPAGTYNLVTGATGISTSHFTLNTTPSGYNLALVVSGTSLQLVSTVPAAPTGLSGSSSGTTAAITWTAPSGAVTGYTIYRSTTSSGTYSQIDTSSTTSYSDSTITAGQVYYYTVSASNKAGEGPQSSSVMVLPANSLKWSTTAASGAWNTAANWQSGSVPTSGKAVIFGASTTSTLSNDLSAGFTVGGITFTSDTAAYTMSGNALTLAGDILGFGSANQNLAMNLALSGDRTVSLAGGTLTLGGVVSGGQALTKAGNGTLVLNGTNTYTGGTTLTAGTLSVGNDGALGTTGALTLSGGTITWPTASATCAKSIVATSGTTTTALRTTASSTLVWSGPLTGSGTIIANASSSGTVAAMDLTGDNSGFTGTFQSSGNGLGRFRFSAASSGSANANWVLTLGGTDANRLNFSNGTIAFGSLSGGGLLNSYASGVLAQVGALGTDAGFSGQLVGTFSVQKVGAGTWTLSGANSYGGTTTVSAGTLSVTGAVTGAGAVTVASGATLGGTGSIAGPTTLQSGGTIAPGTSSANGTLTVRGALTLNGGSTLAFALGSSTSDQLALTSSYTAPTSGTVTVAITAGNGVGQGNYTLVTGATGISASSFALAAMPRGYQGGLSVSGSALILTLTPLPTPTGLTATPGDGTVALSWTAVTGATSYTVRRSTTSGSGFAVVASGLTATTWTDTGLSNGTTYYYVVSATTAAGEGPDSSQVPVTLAATLPGFPGSLTAVAGDGTVALSWTAVTGATSYTVRRSTTSGSGFAILASGLTVRTFADSGLVNGTTYFYTVSASNSLGEGTASLQVGATPASTSVPSSSDSGSSASSSSDSGNGVCGLGSIFSLGMLLVLRSVLLSRFRSA